MSRHTKTVRFQGNVYEEVDPSSSDFVYAQLVEAASAAPRSKEEWQEFAQDVLSFYEDQLNQIGALKDVVEGIKSIRPLIDAAQASFQRAQRTHHILDISEAIRLAYALYKEGFKKALARSSGQWAKLRKIKKWAKQHEKLKRKIDTMVKPKQKIKKWLR